MKKYIVSMTTFPKRIELCKKTIESILNQTFKDFELNLYLNDWEFNGIPEELKDINDNRLNIKWIKYEDFNGDIKSFKKVIPILKEYIDSNDVIIITSDDDVIIKDKHYYEYMIEDLGNKNNSFITSMEVGGVCGNTMFYPIELFKDFNFKNCINNFSSIESEKLLYHDDLLLFAYLSNKNYICLFNNLRNSMLNDVCRDDSSIRKYYEKSFVNNDIEGQIYKKEYLDYLCNLLNINSIDFVQKNFLVYRNSINVSKPFNICIPIKSDRWDNFKRNFLYNTLNFSNLNYVRRIVLVPNGFTKEQLDEINSIKCNKLAVVEGDTKYKLLNKYIPYVNEFGTDTYTLHLDDDTFFDIDFIVRMFKYSLKYKNMSIFGSCETYIKYKINGDRLIFGRGRTPIPFPIITNHFKPMCGFWISIPKTFENSELINADTIIKNDEYLYILQALDRNQQFVVLNGPFLSDDSVIRFGINDIRESNNPDNNIYNDKFVNELNLRKDKIKQTNDYIIVDDYNYYAVKMLSNKYKDIGLDNPKIIFDPETKTITKYEFLYDWFDE